MRTLPLLALLFAALASARAAKNPAPAVSIPLEPLGYSAPATHFTSPRATNYTVNFVDPTHLLFTFNSHGLIPRSPADREEGDSDRNVTALLLELPSGAVLARTTWHLHDQSPYLWPLHNGRFLLRIRTRIEVLDPLRRLPEGDAFKTQSLVDVKRRFAYLSLSPDADVFAIQTIPKLKARLVVDLDKVAKTAQQAAHEAARSDSEDDEIDRRDPVRIHLYRLHEEPSPTSRQTRLYAQSAGVLYSPQVASLPITAEGYLDIAKEAANAYGFDFHAHTGAKSELSGYETSCIPHPFFVSRSEFVALGCHGGAERNEISFFNLRGEQPWAGGFREPYISPVVLAAPAAGRFVLSRSLLLSSLVDADALSFDNLTTQDITVYQNFDGRVLLKLQVTPIQITGQNFDLLANGQAFAIVRNTALEIYLLPPPTARDESEIKRAQAAFPPPNDVEISLDSTRVSRKSDALAEGVHKGAEVLKPTPKSAGQTATPSQTQSQTSPQTSSQTASPTASPTPSQPSSSPATPPTESLASSPIDTAASPSQPPAEPNANLVGDIPTPRTKPPSLFDPEHPKPPN